MDDNRPDPDPEEIEEPDPDTDRDPSETEGRREKTVSGGRLVVECLAKPACLYHSTTSLKSYWTGM